MSKHSQPNTLAIVAVILALLVGGYFLLTRPQLPVQPEQTEQTEQSYGGMPGNELQGPEFKVAGVNRFYVRQAFTNATRTPIAIRSPFATSTLVSFSCYASVSTTTAFQVEFAKATTAFATTTRIGGLIAAAAAEKLVYVASTTPTQDLTVFGPGQYAVMKWGGGEGTYSPTGGCNAVFEVL